MEHLHPTEFPFKTLGALSAVFTSPFCGRILFTRLGYLGSGEHPTHNDVSFPLFGAIATLFYCREKITAGTCIELLVADCSAK